ncbi:unnamed protein product, partial [Closterium sp. NIES-54]
MVTIAVVLVFFGAWAIFSPTNNAVSSARLVKPGDLIVRGVMEQEEVEEDVVGESEPSVTQFTYNVVFSALPLFRSPLPQAVEALAEEEVEDVVGESEQRLEADVKVAEAIQRAKNRAKPKDVAVEAEASSGLAEETGAEGAGEEDEQGVEVAGGEEGGSDEGGGEEGGGEVGGGKEAGNGGEEEEGGGEEEKGADAGAGRGKGGRGGGGGKESVEEGSEEEEEGGGGGGVKGAASEEEGESEGEEEEKGGKGVQGKKGGEEEEGDAAGEEGGEGEGAAEEGGEVKGGKAAGNSKFFSADLAAVEAAWDSEDAAAADPNVPAADLRTESTSSEAGSGLETQARESEEEARLDIREAATKKQESKKTEDDFGEVEGGATIIQSSPESKDPPLMAGPVGQGTGEEGGGALPSLDLENAKFRWPSCGGNRTDWVPCLDNEKAIKALKTNKHYEHRERHCPLPGEMEKCLVPLPKGYKAHVPWPESRDQVWYNNVPHPGLASYKKDQNWVAMEGDKLVFPGGGTQFTHGATGYINFVQK